MSSLVLVSEASLVGDHHLLSPLPTIHSPAILHKQSHHPHTITHPHTNNHKHTTPTHKTQQGKQPTTNPQQANPVPKHELMTVQHPSLLCFVFPSFCVLPSPTLGHALSQPSPFPLNSEADHTTIPRLFALSQHTTLFLVLSPSPLTSPNSPTILHKHPTIFTQTTHTHTTTTTPTPQQRQ